MMILGFSPSGRFFSAIVAALALTIVGAPLAMAQADDHSPWKKAKPATTTKPADTKATDRDKLKAEGEKLFGPSGAGGDKAESGAKGWAVCLGAFKGEDYQQRAATRLAWIRTQGGVPEAYAAKRNDSVIIAVGDFSGPEDDKAKSELARIQAMEVGGERPYGAAMLSPPLEWKMAGSMPKFNLAKAKEQFGDGALYTLQVGAYGRRDLRSPTEEDLKEVRSAAEEAAAKLRSEGELAFYYHGPTMSMVTVGVFDEKDFDPQIPSYVSPRLREAMKRNPLNLYNGAGVKVKPKGGKEQLQSSGLVEIPKG
ncbi:MAG TPA: hypothetical protein PKE29_03230 [Phycisphaerales bacterium]|nr:hypothetical protein [Phycisphaerales bacterium]